MKVIIAIPCLLTGGTEIQTLNLARALVLNGHDVTTVCYFEHTEYMISQYKNAGSKVELFSADGKRVGGVKCVWFLFKNLLRIQRTMKPDVVHVQYMAPGAIPIILLWLMGQKNIVATLHTNSDIYTQKQLNLIRFLERYVTKAFTCITQIAERGFFGSSSLFTQNTVLKNNNHFTMHNSLPYNLPLLSNLPQKNITDNNYVIGFVGRLELIKGADFVIPAFAEVIKKYPSVRLIIVGDGNLKEQLHNQAEHFNIEHAITWTGRLPQNELPSWYQKIDILLMPSRSEGFGLTAIEGMSNGCVVVASNTGGLPEVVVDMQTGLLHEANSIKDIAEKTISLIESENLLTEIRISSLKHCFSYSFVSFKDKVQALYNKF